MSKVSLAIETEKAGLKQVLLWRKLGKRSVLPTAVLICCTLATSPYWKGPGNIVTALWLGLIAINRLLN